MFILHLSFQISSAENTSKASIAACYSIKKDSSPQKMKSHDTSSFEKISLELAPFHKGRLPRLHKASPSAALDDCFIK